ncbi:MAG TPA: hypothetical protein VIG74_05940 [Alphaproteobacteria bacterium]|jgi:hypothetical protein
MDIDGFKQEADDGDEYFDSLDDALFALDRSLAEDLTQIEHKLCDSLCARTVDTRKLSRLAGYESALTYVWAQIIEVNNRFTPAGQIVAQLHDDPSFLPELMESMLVQIKFLRATGGLLRSSMVLSPSRLAKLLPEGAALPDLDRAAVAEGNREAINWLKTDIFPLFKGLCPPPPSAPEPPQLG